MARDVATGELGFTRAEYDRLPEDFRAELVDGDLLKMGPPTVEHQRVLMRVLEALTRAAGWDRVLPGPAGFAVDAQTVLVPDALVLAAPPPADAKDVSAAVLVVEVLSPSTAARDRGVKADKYLGAGVEEVWLVDPAARTVTVRRAKGASTHAEDDAAASRAVPGLRLVPAELFA